MKLLYSKELSQTFVLMKMLLALLSQIQHKASVLLNLLVMHHQFYQIQIKLKLLLVIQLQQLIYQI